MHFRTSGAALLSGAAVLSLFTGACATKRNVREAIAPVQQQLNDVQKKGQENTAAIGDLDRSVAHVDEKAMEADRKAVAAGQAADRANQSAERASQSAGQAQQAADKANDLAQQGITRATALETRVNNLDNYKLATTEKVYFRLNRWELTPEGKAKLDEAIQALQNNQHYVIEVAGYTDSTGNRAANLELSRRRADAVVRYLTIQHDVPLRKIHDVGAGSDFPDANNKNRAARKENRRVDVRIFTLDTQSAGLNNSDSRSGLLSSTAKAETR